MRRDKKVTVRLSSQEALRLMVAAEGMPLSDFVRDAIRRRIEWLERALSLKMKYRSPGISTMVREGMEQEHDHLTKNLERTTDSPNSQRKNTKRPSV